MGPAGQGRNESEVASAGRTAMSERERILFYLKSEPHGWCSNFAEYPIVLNGKLWPTNEHYYQAMKFEGTAREEKVRQAPSAKKAWQLGRDARYPIRKDWVRVRDSVMLDAVRAKFSQHAELRDKLLATGEAELVEHTRNDDYWGDGGDGSGRNMLGVMLMAVRNELRHDRELERGA